MRFQIEILSDPMCLKMMRDTVANFCAMAGMGESEKCQVVLAVDEACSNIIRHSYEGATDKPIICEGKVEDDAIVIILRDYGKKVDLSKIRPRDISNVRPGGLGVHFIREVMDSVVFEDCGDEGTCLLLRKEFPKSGARK
jgi:anti-sigma regulatory factor (Ser/Thr protein kinase)